MVAMLSLSAINKRKIMKTKNLILNGQIKTKVDEQGERVVTFVASSCNVDREGETVVVDSLRLPLRAGGYVRAGEIPAGGIDLVDIPLMLNHSFDVTDVIGSVRRAFYENGELIFEAGIATTTKAQEILTLIEGGHLGNAFSLTMADYDYNFDTGAISNAEVLEVSVVYRGANREARVLSVKGIKEKGEEVEKVEKQNDIHGLANGDGVDHSDEVKATEVVVEVVEAEKVEDNAEPVKESEEEKTEEVKEEKKEDEEMDKNIATDGVASKSAPVQAVNSGDYLKSSKALVDFKNIVTKYHRGSNDQIMREWQNNLSSKAITGDAILPAAIENIFFKAWVDNDGILGTFRFLGVKNGAVYAGSSSDTAKGHKKGETKADQTVNFIRRDLKALAVYKKLPIDLQDLFDDETGQLLAFRVEELAARIANAIAVGAILNKGAGNDATLQDIRGLYPMADDVKATSGFGQYVATKLEAEAGEGAYEMAVRALASVKDANGTGAGKILVVPEGFTAKLRLQKDSGGRLLLPIGANIAEILGAKAIFEMPELKPSAAGDIEVIAYLDQSYILVGEATGNTRTDFDLNTNTDVMLQERFVGGSAQGYKTVAAVVRK